MRTEYKFTQGNTSYKAVDPDWAYERAPDGWASTSDADAFAAELLKAARVLDAYDELAREFIDKVERGEARSAVTYVRFIALLARELGLGGVSERAFDAADDASRAEEGLVEPPPALVERESREKGEL